MNKRKILSYAISFLIASLMTVAILYLHGIKNEGELAGKYRVLADAFTIPGVVFIFLYILTVISNTGFFDGLSYTLTYLRKTLFPFGKSAGTHTRYADYVEEKRKKRSSGGMGFIFMTGLVFFLVSLVFIYLYYGVSA